jgi:RNA-binding motif X-linked protein 2
MNPLTQVKNTQKATQREIALGLSENASWHARFKHSAYIFAGAWAGGTQHAPCHLLHSCQPHLAACRCLTSPGFPSARLASAVTHVLLSTAGGLDFELTEGDLLAVFAQYGELLDVNLCKDKASARHHEQTLGQGRSAG